MKLNTTLAVMVFAAGSLQAQGVTPDPLRHFATREELADLLVRWEGAAESEAYSAELRATARQEAASIRGRLEDGDFKVGDRVFLTVVEDSSILDTFLIDVGPVLEIPNIGAVSLAGVLRVEVEDYMTEQLSRFIRNPTVRARALLQLTATGGVANPGFHTFASTATVADVIRATGVGQNASIDGARIERDGIVLVSGEAMRTALTFGSTLDQLGVRAGDEVHLPIQLATTRGMNPQVVVQTLTMLMGMPFAILGLIQSINN